jgi:hypothetical protein
LVKSTKNSSSGSIWVSPRISTAIFFCVSPGAKVRVPEVAT